MTSPTAQYEDSVDSNKSLSMFLILLGNIAPLIGVLFFDWNIGNVVILYWVENLVIGFWTLVKMLTARGSSSHSVALGATLFMCAFFTVHYGMFCMGHGTFITVILGNSSAGGGFFPFESMLRGNLITTGVFIGTGLLFVNYGISYVTDYIFSGDYKKWNAHTLMFTPYGHIFVVHIAVMIGAGISAFQGSPMWLMIALIIGKTLLELKVIHFKNRLRQKKN